jgi:Ulp1 family protease
MSKYSFDAITESQEALNRKRIVREDVAFLMEDGMSKTEAYAIVRSCDEINRWNSRLASKR